MVSFTINYEGAVEIHVDSIAIAILAVNALSAGVRVQITQATPASSNRLVKFLRDGVSFIGFVDASVVDEWEIANVSAACSPELVA
jgi:hypothetical protein